MCCLLHSALPAPVVTISFSGDSTAGEDYSLQCSASVVAGLVVLPDLKIVFPNSTEISVMDSSSLDYMFSPLRTSDGGQYTCTATVNISQAGIMDLQNSAVETMVVVGKQRTDSHLHIHDKQSKANIYTQDSFFFFQRKNCPGWDSNPRHSAF